jgi:hypothetical protein
VSKDSPLEGANNTKLMQISTICRSAYEIDGALVAVFGPTGEMVAKIIDDHLSGADEKKEKKKDTKPKGDPRENKLISIYIDECEKATGRKPVIKWGTDRLHMRRALSAGWTVDDLGDMIRIFFEHGKSPEGKFTFKNGSVKNFVDGLTKLCVLKSQSGPRVNREVFIPEGEVDKVAD